MVIRRVESAKWYAYTGDRGRGLHLQKDTSAVKYKKIDLQMLCQPHNQLFLVNLRTCSRDTFV